MSGSESSARVSDVLPEAVPEAMQMAVHSMPSADLDSPVRRTTLGRWKMLAVLAVCASPVIASYFTYFVIKPQARTNYSELITPTRDLPDGLPLRTLDGQPVAARSLHGQWLLIVVADAACDAVCEKALYLQRQLRETLGREAERVDKLWLIPDGGTPRAEVLTGIGGGVPTRVLRVPREALASWLAPAEGKTLAQHHYVVDPMGRWMMRTPSDPEPAKFKRDIERLLRASASWDQPGR